MKSKEMPEKKNYLLPSENIIKMVLELNTVGNW